MAALETLWQQALELSDEERIELAARLLRSLEPSQLRTLELADEDWRGEWTGEIDRRLREVRDGKVTPVDGDEVFRRARERIAANRR
jgi:putative addiction module component (TIGR02574 family)